MKSALHNTSFYAFSTPAFSLTLIQFWSFFSRSRLVTSHTQPKTFFAAVNFPGDIELRLMTLTSELDLDLS